jgi:isoleucyl-tRNA synthetase
MLNKLDGDLELIYPPEKTNGVDELRTTLMLSQIKLVDSADEVKSQCDEKYVVLSDTLSGCAIGVKKAEGKKCQRCWFFDESVGEHGLEHSDACQKCNHAISSWEKARNTKFIRKAAEAKQPTA